MMFKRWILPILLVVLATGCDTVGSEKPTPPQQLAPAAFQMDTNLFNQEPASTDETSARYSKAEGAYSNFFAAALRVLPVSLVVKAHLIIPSVATKAALKAEPTYEEDSWVWASTVSVQGNTVDFALNGVAAEGGADWELHITYDNPEKGVSLKDFIFYTAETRNAGTEGSWKLFYPLDGVRTNVLSADFVIEGETEKSITFTVPDAAEASAGASIEYTRDGEIRTFKWTEAETGKQHVVKWNAVTKAGVITVDGYNGGEKACWGPDLKNAPCPVL